jgi:acetyl-CoA carboxylase biotin carboxylase subunit
MVAKVITHGATRDEAMARMRLALSELVVEGISTNISLHRDILDDPAFCAGGVDIHHLERWLQQRSPT